MAARGDGAHRDAASSARGCGRRCRSSSTARSSAPSSCASRRGCSARTWPPRRSSAARRCATSACSASRSGWRSRCPRTRAVEHADEVDRFAVVGDGTVALVAAADATIEPAASLDVGIPLFTVTFDACASRIDADVARLTAIGALLAAAESVGAAERMLADARDYAAERRQFGRTIGSYQALRHILADMYVRRASAWSTVLYAAAALDDELPDAQRTAAIAKAYVARAAREVAHGALQVFGGIAFTEEHQAHRFLRRIIVREQQFGDAAHHERELGRALAVAAMERA